MTSCWCPKSLDFLYVGHEEQLAAEQFRRVVELRVGELRPRERKENPEDITEIIEHKGRPGARRQAALGVGDLAAEFVPHLRQRLCVVLVPDRDGHRAASAFGARNHSLQLLELLGCKFDDVADLFLHFLRGCAGVGSDDEGVFDRELGVFQPRQVNVGPDPQHDHEHGEDECDRLVANGRLGNIHGRQIRGCSFASAEPSSRPTKSGRRR